MRLANEVYDRLNAAGVEVLLDDRNERPGVKFKDAELIGVPCRIVFGKKCGEGIVEFRLRNSSENEEIAIQDIEKVLEERVK